MEAAFKGGAYDWARKSWLMTASNSPVTRKMAWSGRVAAFSSGPGSVWGGGAGNAQLGGAVEAGDGAGADDSE